MKRFLSIVLFALTSFCWKVSVAQTYIVPNAQVQPTWIFPLWFEDGNGERDTVYFCYDPASDNSGIGHDTIFGEKFTIQDTAKFFLSLSCICPPNDTIAIKTIVFPGLPSSELGIWKAKLPLKIKWDKNLFYDSTLLSIPLTNHLPDPLFEIKLLCSDFNPNYNNCGVNYPIFWIPEDNIGCCPDPYGLGIKTDSMVFNGDAFGPLSIMTNSISLNFSPYEAWVNIEELNSDDVQIFPNPFTTSTTITLPNYIAPFNLQLFDELGRKTPLQYHTAQQGNNTTLTLDRDDLLSGVYFLSIVSGEKKELVKLMVE